MLAKVVIRDGRKIVHEDVKRTSQIGNLVEKAIRNGHTVTLSPKK